MSVALPTLDPMSAAASAALCAHLQNQIAETGPMSFAQFMQAILYTPGMGYYSAGSRKFGAEGDFVTAPEISPLFSGCLARQCQQILAQVTDGVIFELGAGTGTMAKDILLTLTEMNALPTAYWILEVSADLKARQQTLLRDALPDFFANIHWLDRLPEQAWSGVLLANEVLDAMPVEKFKWVEGALQQFNVVNKADGFDWQLAPVTNPDFLAQFEALDIDFADGYESELNLALQSWVQSTTHLLQRGAALLIDYGFPRHEFYHPDRNRGTIMCHYRHHAHDDPLIFPGVQDVTAHVDFTAVAEAAVMADLDVVGFTNQAAFLINCGLTELAPVEQIKQQFMLSQQIKKLTMPQEMGELFKVIALARDIDEPLLGFLAMNQLGRL